MIIQAALCEDDPGSVQSFEAHIARFETENHVKVNLTHFTNPIQLLENYAPRFDVIFMDIRMPHMDGMEAAHRLRKMDQNTVLIFLTELSGYAVEGYTVNALDYILKPVGYYDFALKFSRAIDALEQMLQNRMTIHTKGGWVSISAEQIVYIEADGHHVVVHTENDSYREYGTLQQYERKLKGKDFSLCNRCYLVNLHYVTQLQGYEVHLGDVSLQISHPRKSYFLKEYKAYIFKNAIIN